MTYVVIVTGSRDADERHRPQVERMLQPIRDTHGTNVLLRHGQCPYGGVDLIADRVAQDWGWKVDRMPADVVNGRIQGPARNRAMCAKQPRADEVIALPGPRSRGTWDCLKAAAQYRIPFRGDALTTPATPKETTP